MVVTNDMFRTNSNTTNIMKLLLLCLPVSNASVDHVSCHETKLRNRLSDTTLCHLMKIAIEGPDSYIILIMEDIVDTGEN